MIAIIAEKYNLDASEMINVVTEDPRYKQMQMHPVIDSLGHFNKEDLTKQIPPTEGVAAVAAVAAVAEAVAVVVEEPKKVVMKLKKKKAAASSASDSVEK